MISSASGMVEQRKFAASPSFPSSPLIVAGGTDDAGAFL
jgi:hypothetical protein